MIHEQPPLLRPTALYKQRRSEELQLLQHLLLTCCVDHTAESVARS